jgi:hypothetical protein
MILFEDGVNCDSSVGIATRLRAGQLGWSGFVSRRGLGTFLFATAPTQPLMQWVSGVLSPGVKRQGREADHLPPSSAEVKNSWNSSINFRGVVLS